jgi:hypothetical protein
MLGRREFYNMKSPVKLSALLLLLFAACAASQAAPKRPWRVEVTTTGGIAGRGTGDYAIDSDGNVTARLIDGRSCTFKTSPNNIEAILTKARPSEWKESYLPENPCCDRFEYTLTYDEAGVKKTTKWIDDPLPRPADLVALANAIVGGEPSSIRMLAGEQCR